MIYAFIFKYTHDLCIIMYKYIHIYMWGLTMIIVFSLVMVTQISIHLAVSKPMV